MKAIIDNDVYNRMSKGWWDPNSFLNMLETGIHPIRSDYIKKCLTDHAPTHRPLKIIDVGCGGGIICEDLARQQHDVTGVDISQKSLDTASKHAQENNLAIQYLLSNAEKLPFQDNSIDAVTCCDVLEHVDDVNSVIREISRVLKPGGIFIYDTINKTLVSRIATIDIAQNIAWTRFMPKNTHVWHQYIRPKTLLSYLDHHQMTHLNHQGMGPSINPLAMLLKIYDLKKGKINYAQFGSATTFTYTKSMSISYLGCARKR